MIVRQIQWNKRYSQTDELDEFGRWARVGYISDEPGLMPVSMQFAWIEKGEKFPFVMRLNFPYEGPIVFNTLEDAQQMAQAALEHFINRCIEP
jgi:hypothetical protein